MASDEKSEQPPSQPGQIASQAWRQAAYAPRTSSQVQKRATADVGTTDKVRSSTSQRNLLASGFVKESKASQAASSTDARSSAAQRTLLASGFVKDKKASQVASASSSKNDPTSQGSSVGLGSSSGSSNIPLYSIKATNEVRALTSKKGLKDEANPITHSRMGERTQHYVSSATGHQVANRVGPAQPGAAWQEVRQSKLREQAAESSSKIFQGVTAYLNGYQGQDRVNLDITKTIQENGGKVNYLYTKSQCTHIISSMALSGKKNQEWLIDKRKGSAAPKLVRPEWVYDSVAAGRRLAESKYAVFQNQTQGNLLNTFVRTAEPSASAAAGNAAESASPSDDPAA
ncbi:hypothetical protein OC845_001946 [Tilletia horrida]|nr:hypothetical protein OC845_001946 [Tilletia horrida]